ncbi:RagB/SusD family nutrient uptake outer membrane protein [Prolixibacteraceae bacterium JC049]|nr:RagB/SusD family nutrient uptake outer membrane protein [Prolixibacteraceae bacterium JC049]
MLDSKIRSIMRKLHIFAILLSFATIFTSCDGFLDIVPTGRVIPKTHEEFRALLATAYNNFPKDRGLATFRTDETRMNTTSEFDINNFRDIYLWNDTNPLTSTFPFKWLDYYEVIFVCNHIIQEQNNVKEATTEQINQLVGEAYMLRAYTYFTLANLFAQPYEANQAESIPAVPLNLDNDTDAVLPKSSLAKVYGQINSDIKEGLDRLNVKDQTTENNYRFSTNSGRALQLRVALYQQKWTEAITVGKELLANTNKTLSDLNKSTKIEPSSFDSDENLLALELVLPSDYSRALYLSDKLRDSYDTNDQRLKRYFKAVTKYTYTIKKAGSTKYRCTFRLGEVYLSLAEASAKNNNIDDAKQYLKTLLQNRLRSTLFEAESNKIDALSGDDLMEYILNERFKELAFEGHRWFDLRRTNQEAINHTFDGQTYTLKQNDNRYTLPIPQEARLNNPNL